MSCCEDSTNPGRVPGGKASFLTTVAPEVIAKSDWTRHEITATLRGSYTAYDKTPELDRPASGPGKHPREEGMSS